MNLKFRYHTNVSSFKNCHEKFTKCPKSNKCRVSNKSKGGQKNQKSISIHLSYLERLEYFNSNADLFSNISKYFEILDSSRVTGNNDHTH